MARLSLTFFVNDQVSPKPRILDTEDEEVGKEWLIGRPSPYNYPDIAFSHPTISREHALIRCITQYQRDQWQIKHVGRHGTARLSAGGERILLDFDRWQNIRDDDIFCFGFTNHGFRATTAIDETIEHNFGFEDDDGTPTVNETIEEAIEEAQAQQQAAHGRTWADVAMLILNGPPEAPSWVVWLLWVLAGIGGVHLAAEWIRNR